MERSQAISEHLSVKIFLLVWYSQLNACRRVRESRSAKFSVKLQSSNVILIRSRHALPPPDELAPSKFRTATWIDSAEHRKGV
jgi:hypothetical protein